MLISYPYWWAQAAAFVNEMTNMVLSLPAVTTGLHKLMLYAVDGVALGGWQLIDLGLMAAIGGLLLSLIFLKVVIILLGALLYATGPITIGLVPTDSGAAISRAWLSAAGMLLVLPVMWAAVFAVGALLINDAGTAGPLIAGNGDVGSLLGGVLLAVAGLASLWVCLRVAREAGSLMRIQLGGMLALARGTQYLCPDHEREQQRGPVAAELHQPGLAGHERRRGRARPRRRRRRGRGPRWSTDRRRRPPRRARQRQRRDPGRRRGRGSGRGDADRALARRRRGRADGQVRHRQLAEHRARHIAHRTPPLRLGEHNAAAAGRHDTRRAQAAAGCESGYGCTARSHGRRRHRHARAGSSPRSPAGRCDARGQRPGGPVGRPTVGHVGFRLGSRSPPEPGSASGARSANHDATLNA